MLKECTNAIRLVKEGFFLGEGEVGLVDVTLPWVQRLWILGEFRWG